MKGNRYSRKSRRLFVSGIMALVMFISLSQEGAVSFGTEAPVVYAEEILIGEAAEPMEVLAEPEVVPADSEAAGADPLPAEEPETPSASEPDTPVTNEPDTPSANEPDTSAANAPGISVDNIDIVPNGNGRVYLGIDNRHAYEGMQQSFAEGYVPTVEENAFNLVVPITASGKLKDEKLTVDLEFEEKSEAPFRYKNYQKDVKKETYTFEAETGQETVEAYVYRCRVELQDGAPSGQYSVTVKASGYTEDGDKITLDYRIFIQVPEQEAPGSSGTAAPAEGGGGGYSGGGGGGTQAEEIIHQPKMLLESCNLAGQSLEAGSKETLKVSFCNRSQSQSMYNLKIVLSSASAGVMPERNSFYFSKVSPGEEISLSEQIAIAQDAEASSVPLTFTFEYEDSKGSASTGTETVNINISQPVRMEIETAEIPAVLYASDTVSIPVKVLNLSRTGAYNVRMKLSGTGLFPNEEVFIGNMEPGTQGEGTMQVYIGTRTMEAIGKDEGTDDQEKYGPVEGTVTLEYEDASGNVYEMTKAYQAEIKKAQILSLKVEKEEEANDWWISVFAVIILAMVTWIILLFGRLRRKSVLLTEARKEAGYEG